MVEKEKNAHESSDTKDDYPNADHRVAHIFGGCTSYVSNRGYKKVEHQVCATSQGMITKLAWFDIPITFSDDDHPAIYTTPGRYPIVVVPTIRNIKVARIMIDGFEYKTFN
ncbi:hypothetical protein E2562_002545 [Oryza meyeriana var. granulata]|uniref:Uncharacterized protein n=1 Tax=Oryza meyeriana var. granulata TaxID=110450 RepID=A0A6G1F2R4_9ORYZ|nr:hypothetical protein E2562_002545 [Oryza meyeriana var. granulata]